MGRKVEINYSKVKEISDLGLSIKETLERLHQCNINISRMQYYRWQKGEQKVIPNKENKKCKGFVYILDNPSLEGMVKIGATTKKPSKRMLGIIIKYINSNTIQYCLLSTINESI